MFSLADIYHPITASPFKNNNTYREISPCRLLSPYIRCFWGTETIINECTSHSNVIVIPDTCMDIIFTIDYINDLIDHTFCTIDQNPYTSSVTHNIPGTANFGIRFYPWSAILFSSEDFTSASNTHIDANFFFRSMIQKIESKLLSTHNIFERVKITENILLAHLSDRTLNADLMNSLYYGLTGYSARVSDLCGYASVSTRQLERIYKKTIGISPKVLLELIRYQRLWQDMILYKNLNIHDAVDKYGYFDQSHLLNNFKRFHQMTPNEAVKYALENR